MIKVELKAIISIHMSSHKDIALICASSVVALP